VTIFMASSETSFVALIDRLADADMNRPATPPPSGATFIGSGPSTPGGNLVAGAACEPSAGAPRALDSPPSVS